MASHQQQCGLWILPDEIFEKILSYVPFEEVSNSRVVSRKFNVGCQQYLNKGFTRADKFHGQCQREVRCLLPRRESERRNHPLARHVDILAAIETRLSLLHMTFMKYIDMGLCSFIPGKVLDEIFRVLRLVQRDQKPPRAHELLQELRDISSMAMEHFDEKIVPILKAKMPPMHLALGTSLSIASTSGGSSFCVPTSTPVVQNRIPALRQDIMQVRHNIRSTHMTVVSLKKESTDAKSHIDELRKKSLEQEKRLIDQDRVIMDQGRKIAEQDKLIGEMNQKLLEYDEKLADVFTELAKVRPVTEDGEGAGGDKSSTGGARRGARSKHHHRQARQDSPPARPPTARGDGGQETLERAESLTRKRRDHCTKSGGKAGPAKRSRVH